MTRRNWDLGWGEGVDKPLDLGFDRIERLLLLLVLLVEPHVVQVQLLVVLMEALDVLFRCQRLLFSSESLGGPSVIHLSLQV